MKKLILAIILTSCVDGEIVEKTRCNGNVIEYFDGESWQAEFDCEKYQVAWSGKI